MTSVAGTNNVWPNYSANNTSGSSSSGSGVLGKDDFLKILVAQLANQDPMQPMEDKEFIAQMAQFSSVEQMYNITAELTSLRQAVGLNPALIGKSIAWNDTDAYGSTTEKTGVVEGVRFKNGYQYAIVGGKDVSIDKLTRIWETADSPTDTTTGSTSNETTPGTSGSSTETNDAVTGTDEAAGTGTDKSAAETGENAQESGNGL